MLSLCHERVARVAGKGTRPAALQAYLTPFQGGGEGVQGGESVEDKRLDG